MLHTEGRWFKDEHGRVVVLRGVNLAGSSKVPRTPDGATYRPEGFFDHRNVSFVGRPFPLEEADEHYARLKAWGFDFLRFLITWEAIEHRGPGEYDRDYLDYLEAVIRKAGEHGLRLFVDPHQDVWGRLSGGDGAPGWTYECVGLDPMNFTETGAAIVHAVHGDPFPRMIWPTNYSKLAAATMFTLFFAGDRFAPRIRVDGETVQGYLQGHYLRSVIEVARRLRGMAHVVGYDTLNEPSAGYIGWRDLLARGGLLHLGPSPTPLQSMALGSGVTQDVELYEMRLTGPKRVGIVRLNEQGARAWTAGTECIWRRHGVWDLRADGTPEVLRPDYFSRIDGREVEFGRDFYRPFANRYAEGIRQMHPDALIFVEDEPLHPPPPWGPQDAGRIVFAPHWYDGFVLYTKTFRSLLAVDAQTGKVVLGRGRIRKSFAAQIARFVQAAEERLGGVPTLIGEFGIPFDLNRKQAFRTGNFRAHLEALDRSFRAIEDNLVSCTLWNYTPDNTNRRGDQWNDEDLSLFSRDQQTHPDDIYSGGRALEAAVRPYPRATAGVPTQMAFDWRSRHFVYEFRHDTNCRAPTEVFLPSFAYRDGCRIEVSDGTFELGKAAQVLTYRHGQAQPTHRIDVYPR